MNSFMARTMVVMRLVPSSMPSRASPMSRSITGSDSARSASAMARRTSSVPLRSSIARSLLFTWCRLENACRSSSTLSPTNCTGVLISWAMPDGHQPHRLQLLGQPQLGLDALAGLALAPQLLGGLDQLQGAALDLGLQVEQVRARLLAQHPLGGQRVRQLADLDGVERLAQDQQAVGGRQPPDDLRPAVIGIGGADDHLQVGIHPPQLVDGLDAVPAGRHADVDEGQAYGRPSESAARTMASASGPW